jgi:hypothetical protein
MPQNCSDRQKHFSSRPDIALLSYLNDGKFEYYNSSAKKLFQFLCTLVKIFPDIRGVTTRSFKGEIT